MTDRLIDQPTDTSFQQPISIVLIEDNPADAELAMRALRRSRIGSHTQWLPDGAEALDFFFCRSNYAHRIITNQPKVIFLDLKLPKVSGLEVLRQLKSDPRTQTIPVVVLTSSDEDRDVIESYQLGANSYIVKPVDFEQFNQAVQQLEFYWVLFNRVPIS
ncbi:response regulator [Anabaena cylindrica FACHB-243]|uniref:Response regulator receiver protein n=1 Tax=Anabaena cylindrica (strain ATCC 27899 / PCC 7122) TaxID=272123 RepID=K9ZQI6_ANACC|nr:MULTISPECIES: response regulator [Anabaena]AFZ60620.1 response regulator receiver protein [Anabaena cylindrica PCC 7122]MBD2417040.1 response regulator [Anabaena cylindrica FACHB-243]MBY5280369.1 response regulator [Anabaena sp. CCAP 1446/1C]MBY5307604.1 response regulator [Anabaena sp. CCAP 1446/1C]MCM2407192.1 response regulator [Anabaena sp. CCAP 1446/1C]